MSTAHGAFGPRGVHAVGEAGNGFDHFLGLIGWDDFAFESLEMIIGQFNLSVK